MPSRLSTIIEQTEEVLQEVLQIIRHDYERPYAVLCETDRKRFVEEEELLSKQLEQQVQSETNSWRNLIGWPSPQAARCLKDAEELRRRVREDVRTKLATMLIGKSNPFPSGRGQDSALDSTGVRTRETDTDTERQVAGGTVVTSPLNMRCSLPGTSGVNANPVVQNDYDYAHALSEAMDAQLGTFDDRNSDTSSQRRRRPPPPPPQHRPIARPNNLSEMTSIARSGSPRRSPSVRRPAPPPPRSPTRSRTPSSTTINSFPSPPPSPAVMSALSQFTRHINTITSSLEDLPRHGTRSRRYVSKTNCIDINDSNVDGLTMNIDGHHNSGAVIHKTEMPPPRVPQPVIRV